MACRAQTDETGNGCFLVSERLNQLNRRTAWAAIRRYGELAGLSLEAHPHMLRHACGYALADQGANTRLIQDYLGHRTIQHTVRYTATNSARLERLWQMMERIAKDAEGGLSFPIIAKTFSPLSQAADNCAASITRRVFRAHPQTTRTRQPAESSLSRVSVSRCWLRSIFDCQ